MLRCNFSSISNSICWLLRAEVNLASLMAILALYIIVIVKKVLLAGKPGIVYDKPTDQGITQLNFQCSKRHLAEERTGRKLGGLKVLNSYWLNEDDGSNAQAGYLAAGRNVQPLRVCGGVLLGRFFVGTGMGITSLYMAVVSPAFVRGTFGSFTQIATCLGLIASLFIGIPAREIVDWWRICFWVSVILAAALALIVEFCAESHH